MKTKFRQTLGAAFAVAGLSVAISACGGTATETTDNIVTTVETDVVQDVVTEVTEEPAIVENTEAEATNGIESLGYPEFAAISESGTGDQIIELPADVTAGMVTATYNGTGHFAITGLDENNEFADLIANTIGAYQGTTAFGLSSLLPTGERLQVSADGDWTIEVQPLSAAPVLPEHGSGNGVFAFTGGAGTWDIEHNGSSNFAVIQYGSGLGGMNLLVNQIGNYSGSVAARPGPSIIVVSADGDWTISH